MKDTQESERHLSDWESCLTQCQKMIEAAHESFASVTSNVCEEVLSTQKAQDYIHSEYRDIGSQGGACDYTTHLYSMKI